jgi:hypothetical protein
VLFPTRNVSQNSPQYVCREEPSEKLLLTSYDKDRHKAFAKNFLLSMNNKQDINKLI